VPVTSNDLSPQPSTDTVLDSERRHLRQARADLAAMRQRTLSLTVQGGDAVSEAYLHASLYRRARALEDDPDIPLFFGRVDIAVDAGPAAQTPAEPEVFHIGRRHVMDAAGDPMVIDWRADVSRAFYRATRARPYGVRLRRRFGFGHGEITSYEDEHLLDTGEHETTSRILTEEIERPRVGPMRDIVATIQPEQDEVVRADLRRTVCVQGAPGTGKTAVGLHRAAYLLHAHREQLARRGVLVVGPNRAFLHYIAQVLPALGEVDVRQVTVAELADAVPVRGTDRLEAALIKGDSRMAEVLRRAVWSHVNPPTEPLVVPRGAHRWRVPAFEVAEALEALAGRGEAYGSVRALLPQRLAHLVLLRIEARGEITDDRVQDAIARSRPVRSYADQLWPAVDPLRLVLRLLTDPEFLAASADGVLSASEQGAILWSRPARGIKTAPWTAADAVLVDEAIGLVERAPGVGHVVLDEAQDLSPMQLRAVGRRCGTGSATVLGDIAQGTTAWSTPSWEEAMRHLGRSDVDLEVLRKGYRVPAAVVAFAARLLPHIAAGIAPPEPVRSNPGRLDLVTDGVAAVGEITASLLERDGSVGVICSDAAAPAVLSALAGAGLEPSALDAEDDARLVVVPATLAKGLEFDHVLVVEPADIVDAEPPLRTGLRRLYVVLTRAVSSLTVLHLRPLPEPLR